MVAGVPLVWTNLRRLEARIPAFSLPLKHAALPCELRGACLPPSTAPGLRTLLSMVMKSTQSLSQLGKALPCGQNWQLPTNT